MNTKRNQIIIRAKTKSYTVYNPSEPIKFVYVALFLSLSFCHTFSLSGQKWLSI